MGLAWLKKAAAKIEGKRNSIFTYPVNKQQAYIAHFPEPKDQLERSYFQYCCQMKLSGKLMHWLLNLAALPMSLALLLKYSRKHVAASDCKTDCLFIRYDLPENIVPDSLRQRYPEMLSIQTLGNCLDREDIAFLKTIFKRYPFSWLFWLKMTIKVSQYSDAIKKHSPGSIISCDEYSFTSSAITAYCHTKGIKRINVMHGEKLYDMHDAFSKYDEFFVWDQAYVDLLVSLRSDADQFVIERPQSLHIINDGHIEKKYDYTYYLTEETDAELEIIAGKLKELQSKGLRISVRPHPRFSDMRRVTAYFSFANIENGKIITIEESLLQTGAAIALHSTVLYQAVSNSIPIVIDDIRNRSHFEKLKELRYVCLHKQHKLLSEITGETQ